MQKTDYCPNVLNEPSTISGSGLRISRLNLSANLLSVSVSCPASMPAPSSKGPKKAPIPKLHASSISFVDTAAIPSLKTLTASLTWIAAKSTGPTTSLDF